jgi:mevalonate pyrophosphate decarboxylase
MKYKFLDKLTQNFSELLNDKEEYNVIIEVDNGPNKKTFTAHSTILRYRSSYFNKELKNIVPNINIIKTIILQNTPAQIFELILK